MTLAVDRSRLTLRQREHYIGPYQRHAWEPSGPGLLSHDRCRKCGAWSITPGALGRLCRVVLAGPPQACLSVGQDLPFLRYPGGLAVCDSGGR